MRWRRWSHMLATLRDEDGNTTVGGLDAAHLGGGPYPPEQFRKDAGVLVEWSCSGRTVADSCGRAPA